MAVSVRIEDEAFADPRVRLLGALLQADEYAALGRLAHLWRACTQLNRYVLPLTLVRQIVDPDALVAAELADEVDDGLRIRGAKGRIEWLETKRRNGRANGWKGKKYGKLGGRPRKTPSPGSENPQLGVTENPPPAPAPAPAPALSPTRERKREAQLPEAWTPTEAHRALALQLHVDLPFEAAQFRDHAKAHGRLAKDWDAAFRTWLRKANRFAIGTRPPPTGPVRQPKLLGDGYTPPGPDSRRGS